MSRQMPAGLMEFLALPNKNVETHSTLQLHVVTKALTQHYYFATASLGYLNIRWLPMMRKVGTIRSSLTRSADQTMVELQNVDTLFGKELLSIQEAFHGASALVGRYWRDLDGGQEWHKVMLTGVAGVLPITETAVQLSIVSDVYANVNVGASRRIAKKCQWRFRDPQTCGYNGGFTVCNFLIDDDGGCNGRHGDPLKRAKFGGESYLDSSTIVTIV